LLDGGGVILNTSSVTGLLGIAGRVGYSAAKAAVANFTRSLALTYAERGIRVNAMAPGPIMTQAMIGEWDQLPDPADGRRRTLATTPINRVAEPEEVANLALFLVSDEASFITRGGHPDRRRQDLRLNAFRPLPLVGAPVRSGGPRPPDR